MRIAVVMVTIAASCSRNQQPAEPKPGQTPTMAAAVSVTDIASPVATMEAAVSVTETAAPSPNELSTPIAEGVAIAPYPDAPLCPDSGEAHDNNLFHTLWDGARGCHYDHEHGQYPFTPEVAAAFPGFDLPALLGPGRAGVGHTNPSSPMENTHKHGGFKWNVQLEHAEGCDPFEGSTLGVDGSVIQYHGFG